MEDAMADDGGGRMDETERTQETDADRIRVELANLLIEIEECLPEEAGYGHGV